MIDDRLRPFVERVWNYHRMDHDLVRSDAILVLCSHATLYATGRGDVATYAATAAALTAAAIAACLLPAHRASRVDPMATLGAD